MKLIERLRRRSAVIRRLRTFFEERDFIEVDTAVAVCSPAPELHIDAIPIDVQCPSGAERRFLQTSPELPMKRLLAAGVPRIFQLAAVFRDGDRSPIHTPEFRLLEWYRRDAPFTDLLDDCEALLTACAEAAGHGALRLRWGKRTINLNPPFERVSVDEAFRTHAGFSILDALDPEELRRRVREAGLACAEDDGWDDLFHRIFLNRVEEGLTKGEKPVFLTHYPAPLAALARLCDDDSRISERFELYVGGLELANGFGELTDAQEQRARFLAEGNARRRAGKCEYPLDERFLSALSELPRAAGIALGIERLLMVLLGADHIDDIACIPWSET